ncbi:helix-turn-helix transcriptional regulator [Parafrankia sp. BMG5.11]|uniref:helix-turn-helix transcriptional regulator n=1 Tax=Parafrankia TaxID=2994362 RepID=UPI000A8E79A4|nr:DeoR family transcriptional regulator, suf operon transcriptional repressor [Frankia sp. Hr75.2]SQD97685.1 Transcriptional regulator, ArsR family [Parafrankia sp. Ea1.12]
MKEITGPSGGRRPPRFDHVLEIGHTGVVKSEQEVSTGATDGRTRDRLVRLLLERGPSTAADLSHELGLSPAAVRRHLDAMTSDGTITTTSTVVHGRRGRGRPARRYTLTEAGHQAGPTAYSDLAAGALLFLADACGPDAVAEFARVRGVDLERRIRDEVVAVPPAERPEAIAAAMTQAGYTASVSELPSGTQICQHHCPVQHVAERFPALCEAETAMLARLLDTHVQRLATIAHGDGVCTTHIPVIPVESITVLSPSGASGPAGAAPDRTPSGQTSQPSTFPEGSL